MDKGILLPIIAFVMSMYLVASLVSYAQISGKWQVDPTRSIISSGNASISKMVSLPQTRVLQFGSKKIVYPAYLERAQVEAVVQSDFKDYLNSSDRLLLYKKGNISFVAASDYFNVNEVDMLGSDERILDMLHSTQGGGLTNLSFIDVKDPTNADRDAVLVDSKITPIIVSHGVYAEALQKLKSSALFISAVRESETAAGKNLFIYQDPNTGAKAIIPVGFSSDEIDRLLKSSAVKTALTLMTVTEGQAVNLKSTPEFSGVDIASLPYNLDEMVYVRFDTSSISEFLPLDWLAYGSAVIAVLILFYLIYRWLL